MIDRHQLARTAVDEWGADQTPDELAYLIGYLQGLDPPPASCLEVGVLNRGTFRVWEALGMATYGIDLNAQGDRIYTGDSHSINAYEFAEQFGPYDVVHIDGDHSADGVEQDLHWYGNMARMAVVLHDVSGYDWPDVEAVYKGLWYPGAFTIQAPPGVHGFGVFPRTGDVPAWA